MTTEEALARLDGVPCGPVNDVLGALEDPQVAARGSIGAYEHPRLGPVRTLAAPYRLGTEYRPAPGRGEDTDAVLRELCGYDDATLDRARSEGAFG